MFSLCIRGRLVEYTRPAVMGIVNATPDSFHAASRAATESAAAAMAAKMAAEGADIIDVGACSTRPGSEAPDASEEWRRLEPALHAVRDAVGPEIPISVDTYRAGVARKAIGNGLADIVNDISCMADPDMLPLLAELRVPYVLTHSRGTAATMQTLTDYGTAGVVAGVIAELAERLDRLTLAGVADVIVDPGFGFAKTRGQNFELLAALPDIEATLRRPVLAGMSRKSMTGVSPSEAIPATCALHMAALERGASLLRVHDVAAALQTIQIHTMLCSTSV